MAVFLSCDDSGCMPVPPALAARIQDEDVNKFESHSGVDVICFSWLDVSDTDQPVHKITVCLTKEQVYYIAKDPETLEKMKALIKPDPQSDKELYSFFSALLQNDIDKMDDLEERITDMEDVLLKDNRTDYTVNIIRFRKELLSLKRYYEQLSQIFDGILENENGFVTKEDIRYFRFLDQKADRLLMHITNLRDYITQLREAYQAQIDIEQNRLMKIFTVITAIFLPLTLIVGWYGMNFNEMPEYAWHFGYLYVIGISVIVVLGLVLYFKRKKWF
ncbi:MAG: magnesium transporter [Oscillospiraceae bacterium]|nr:magnesium transporter [Oscillospiraceae bacterium]